ncbi:MAG: C40 family peptidase [Lachnospiraceae bacterium]|nr:C40 family peptidase [Lachnospiraceae bacterium]
MKKLMTWKRMVYQLTRIAASPTTYDRGSRWAYWDGNKWHFDCVRLVKAVLWQFDFDKSAPHGGCQYPECKALYPDYTTEQMINTCEEISKDMKNIEPGELLWFKGHVGVYIGGGNVVECAPSLKGVAVTSIKYQPWKLHGKLPVITYDEEPAPAPAPVLKPGEALQLTNEPLYASSTRKEPSNHVTGVYYLTDGKLYKGRVRICDEPDDVGEINRVIGWIDWRW